MSDEDSIDDEIPPAYLRLARPREVSRHDLPEDLNRFYAKHDGIGLDAPADHDLRLAKYDEIIAVGWEDLGVGEGLPDPRWKDFRAIRIGRDFGFNTVYYVQWAPGVTAGSILAFGDIDDGPAGQDRGGTVGACVLAACFDDWIGRMERYGRDGSGIGVPIDSPEWIRDKILAELAALNPYGRYAKLGF